MSRTTRRLFVAGVLPAIAALVFVGTSPAQVGLSPQEELGSFLYFDEELSEPAGQSCASCHHPDFGFVDPDAHLPVSEGVIPGLFGGRNSPSSAYAMYSPTRYFDAAEGLWIGGQFWDSRATGLYLGDPLADQAIGPFLNPVEMANPDMETVLGDVLASSYSALFVQECGEVDFDDPSSVEGAYNCIGLAIAAFERTALFAPFTSKYDAYLAACIMAGGQKDDCAMGIGKVADKVAKKYFTPEELDGMRLFMGDNNNDGILDKGEGAMCAACHVVDWTDDPGNVIVPAWSPDGTVPPMFTDFTYDNLGIPKNTAYPLDPDAPVDLGLGPVVGDPADNGKFKVMTLRNIGLTAPYGHNGLFTRLKDIVHLYNTRDVPGSLPGGMDWPPPEVPETINTDELGNLGLGDKEEDALVEFMKTLDDGWRP